MLNTLNSQVEKSAFNCWLLSVWVVGAGKEAADPETVVNVVMRNFIERVHDS